jgi:hypothetical protein
MKSKKWAEYAEPFGIATSAVEPTPGRRAQHAYRCNCPKLSKLTKMRHCCSANFRALRQKKVLPMVSQPTMILKNQNIVFAR